MFSLGPLMYPTNLLLTRLYELCKRNIMFHILQRLRTHISDVSALKNRLASREINPLLCYLIIYLFLTLKRGLIDVNLREHRGQCC